MTIPDKKVDIGMIGLGVMGRNLLLNMADHGFSVIGYDKDLAKVQSLQNEAKAQHAIEATSSLETFLDRLSKPRKIMLLVPAGKPVDAVIDELIPHLQPDDLIIDGGNSHFTDTEVRAKKLEQKGMQLLGVGISGGEEGARRGPSIMPGGSKKAYEAVRPIFEAIAAHADGEPCVAFLGPNPTGHYVKMVHNGIEYGIMQLIAETYDLMKRGLGLSNDQLATVYQSWDQGEMNGYLIEITAQIFRKKEGEAHLIDKILAVAKQNGTGMWTSQSAMTLQVPTPTIDLAVSMRDLSVMVSQRQAANQLYGQGSELSVTDQQQFIQQLHDALYVAMITVYAQGMTLLLSASEQYHYALDLEAVAKLWRGGCIIRASLLEEIAAAFRLKKDLPNLLLDANLAKKIVAKQANMRQVIAQGMTMGIPLPTLMVSLSYLDAYRSVWSPANLIQAQRDYFGSHTYERTDKEGTFHTEWDKE